MTPPRILHIGQRKTATSWLQQGVLAAADLGIARLLHGELRQAQDGKNSRDTPPAVVERIAACLPADRSLPVFASLETLITLDPAVLARAVARVWPDAQVLITTRAPRDYLASSMKGMDLKDEAEIARTARRLSQGHLQRVFDLDHVVAGMAAVFGPGSVHLLPYELLRERPDDFLARVSALIGFDIVPHLPGQRINVSPPPGHIVLHRRLRALVGRMAPEILREPDWERFMAAADFAFRQAGGLEAFIAEELEVKTMPLSLMPRIEPEAMAALAARMTLLRDLPLYRDHLALYGLAPPPPASDPSERPSA